MNRTFKYITGLFFRGMIILGPLGVTAYAIYFIFSSFDNLIPGLNLPPGVGFIMVVFLITFVGFLGTRFFFGRWLVEAFDYLLEHTPGIKFIYTSVKEVLDSFMGDKKKFSDPVWVRVNDAPALWRIGFLTQKNLSELIGETGMVAVYLPHSYAISGWVIVVNTSQVKPIANMSAAEAMKFAVSGGVAGTGPDFSGH
jgi:uncharacterized membrane protein